MPELPEVETIARDLHTRLKGQLVKNITIIGSDSFLHSPISEVRKAIVKNKVKRIFRRAKMLVIDCGSQLIIFHLKMTGQLIYTFKKSFLAGGHPIVSTGVTVPNKYTRLVINFNNGGVLYFNDLRKFGWVKLFSKDEYLQLEKKLGLEPLEGDFSLAFFKKMLARRGRSPIKAVLLDQTYLVGLGNIYVDEVLFRSKVKPSRRTESLTELEIKKLWQSIPVILRNSIKQRGTTFRNYVAPSGLKGNFMNFLKVYGRGNKPCLVCGRLLQKSRIAGRGTHWCLYCQK
jgi:formamidopyrimidine-DNA glycosylase